MVKILTDSYGRYRTAQKLTLNPRPDRGGGGGGNAILAIDHKTTLADRVYRVSHKFVLT